MCHNLSVVSVNESANVIDNHADLSYGKGASIKYIRAEGGGGMPKSGHSTRAQ